MEILELDESFLPKTELGKAMKMMVENGDHCDGNIYWLIYLLEQKQELIESQARAFDGFIKDTERLVARNLVAWDTSKDKREGLLPEVYLTNKYLYKQLTGEEYVFHKAMKKFNIGD